MPKFCPTCGKPLPFENAEICPHCGVRIKPPATIPKKDSGRSILVLIAAGIGILLLFILIAAVIAAFVFGMSGNIAKTKVVALTAYQQGNTIIITYQGGQDANELSRIEYGIGTTDHQWISPKIGARVTLSGATAGKDHVIARGTFNDGVHQVLLDTYV
jgi:archaeal type IV pilus assembly protein PilA